MPKGCKTEEPDNDDEEPDATSMKHRLSLFNCAAQRFKQVYPFLEMGILSDGARSDEIIETLSQTTHKFVEDYRNCSGRGAFCCWQPSTMKWDCDYVARVQIGMILDDTARNALRRVVEKKRLKLLS